MSDPIELSNAEERAAVLLISPILESIARRGDASNDEWALSVLRTAQNAINALRHPPSAALGTVKRDPRTGDLARCEEFDGVRYWAPLILPPGEPWKVDAHSWGTIYDPLKVCIQPVTPIRIARQVVNLDASCRGSDWVDAQGDLWRWDRHATHGRWLRRVGDGPWCITPNTATSMYGPFREVI